MVLTISRKVYMWGGQETNELIDLYQKGDKIQISLCSQDPRRYTYF